MEAGGSKFPCSLHWYCIGRAELGTRIADSTEGGVEREEPLPEAPRASKTMYRSIDVAARELHKLSSTLFSDAKICQKEYSVDKPSVGKCRQAEFSARVRLPFGLTVFGGPENSELRTLQSWYNENVPFPMREAKPFGVVFHPGPTSRTCPRFDWNMHVGCC